MSGKTFDPVMKSKSGIDATAIKAGQTLVATDTAELSVDVAAGQRVKISDIIQVEDEAHLPLVPISGKLYYLEDQHMLVVNDGVDWVHVGKRYPLRKNSTAYLLGDKRSYPNKDGYVLVCTTAGTSAASVPAWPSSIISGVTTITDGSATWTIVDMDARIGMGLPIGAIFAYPLSTPPNGAFLLNGQTIASCDTAFPEFWSWLQDGIGSWVTKEVWVPWTQPVLTGNGTMGVDEFAVSASSEQGGFEAWHAFDGVKGAGNGWGAANGVLPIYTMYSSTPIKIASIDVINADATNYHIATYKVYGSNNNSTWTALTTVLTNDIPTALSTWSMPINSETAYKYHKIEILSIGSGGHAHVTEFTIHATKLGRTYQESSGALRAFNSNTEYENEITEYGQCGAFVISGTSVRLPTINGFVQGNTASADRGKTVAPGLPNITGTVKSSDQAITTQFTGEDFTTSGAFTKINQYSYTGKDETYATNTFGHGFNFDASLCSSIYNSSTTVQPPAVKYSYCIQVFNAASDISTEEVAQLNATIQLKADKNLGNIDSNFDVIRAYHVESDGSFVRIWKSGWVEQGGIIASVTMNSYTSYKLTFLVEFSNTRYTMLLTQDDNNQTLGLADATNGNAVHVKTTSTAVIATCSWTYGRNWYACGQGNPTSINDYIASL